MLRISEKEEGPAMNAEGLVITSEDSRSEPYTKDSPNKKTKNIIYR